MLNGCCLSGRLRILDAMLLKKKNVSGFVLLIAAALFGLLIVQAILLAEAFASRETALRRNVLAVIGAVAQKMATREVISFALEADTLLSVVDSLQTMITVNVSDDRIVGDSLAKLLLTSDTNATNAPVSPVWVENDTLGFRTDSTSRLRLESIDPISGAHVLVLDTVCTPGEHRYSLTDLDLAKGDLFLKASVDNRSIVYRTSRDVPARVLNLETNGTAHRSVAMHIVAGLRDVELQPIESRVNLGELDSVLAGQLREADIDLDYSLAVIDSRDSVRMVSDSNALASLVRSDFRAPLFPQSFLSEPADLVLYFPGRSAWVFRQMLPLAVPSTILIIIIVGCFVYSIRTILTQRRFATHVADFIANMTHEFKTPLSTVQLACEAIAKDSVLADREQILRFNDTILRESLRMKDQAEKILQITEFEEGNVRLTLEDLDLNQLVRSCIECIRLQVASSGGRLELEIGETPLIVRADRFHLAHAVSNILDNAVKYSQESPHIFVRVRPDQPGRRATLSIRDNGIGMEKEHAKRAFEKYYRVPQGNVHNVKGFGLGLSYVKQVVDSHGGEVRIFSEPGEGTEIEIVLPAIHSREAD